MASASYISAALDKYRQRVLVWDRNEHGRTMTAHDAPYYFYAPSETGSFIDIRGNPLEKITASTSKDFYELKKSYTNKGISLYESDISPHYKILAKKYCSDGPYTQPNLCFYDIEVDYDKLRGFSSTANPYAPISSITFIEHFTNKIYVFTVPPNGASPQIDKDIQEKATIKICKNEKELLIKTLEYLDDVDIISGWNNSFFDDVYLYKRILMVLGQVYAELLCFDGCREPRLKEVEKFGQISETIEFFGRQSIDYMDLFKKMEAKERHSYKLADIADDLLPDLPKLEYDGSLYDLYRNDFSFFLRYNIRDVEILKALEDKTGYMAIALEFYRSSTVLLADTLGTVKIIESAIVNSFHQMNKIVPDANTDMLYANTFAGALVLDPIVGEHEFVASVDIESLYPSTIRTLNISPETIAGNFERNYMDFDKLVSKESSQDEVLGLRNYDGDTEYKTIAEWKNYLRENNLSLSGYGTCFTQTKSGVIPQLLTDWFMERKKHKAKIKEISKQLKSEQLTESDRKELTESKEYFNRLQFILKIRLNSTYGMLGNMFSRFFDIRLAESTTRSGRNILMHMDKKVAEFIDGEYTYPSPSIIYSDTDSCYFKTYANTLEQALETAKAANRVVNKSFNNFVMTDFNVCEKHSNYINAEIDIISDKCIFVGKKYYIMHVIYADGGVYDDMKVMGLQIKRTNIPKFISKKLIELFEEYLKGAEWMDIARKVVEFKKSLKNGDIMKLGIPSGVKKVEFYNEQLTSSPTKMIPNHVRGALLWNKNLEKYNDSESVKIISGMKINKFYLQHPDGKFNVICYPQDNQKIPAWFIEHYLPQIDVEKQIEVLINKPTQSILEAIGEQAPTDKILLIKDMVEF